jgi:hypothetical protein
VTGKSANWRKKRYRKDAKMAEVSNELIYETLMDMKSRMTTLEFSEMPSANPERSIVPVASNAERPVPDARRNVTGRAEG